MALEHCTVWAPPAFTVMLPASTEDMGSKKALML
jgi:hypothetical protein